MYSLSKERRRSLLESLKLDSGQADIASADLGKTFFPVTEHLRALEAEVVLVIGDRGAGKSMLQKVLADGKLREVLAQHANLRLPAGSVEWLEGWPLLREGPATMELTKFAQGHGGSRDDAVAMWLAYLVRTLAKQRAVSQVPALAELVKTPGHDPEGVLNRFRNCTSDVHGALDALDRDLETTNGWVFVAYDELDTLVLEDWTALGILVRGLVSFWAGYARRWRRIRPKVFLRSDFYKHHRDIAGADVAKIASNSVHLAWSDRNLYGALLKHILNRSSDLERYFAGTVHVQRDDLLGVIPSLAVAEDARPFVDRLVSPYMGENRKKGLTFKWILDHLRDGGGHSNPRLLVWLIEFAASIEAGAPRAGGAHLLHHISVRNSLDRVSKEYVGQAKTNEFQWLDGLARRLQADRSVPWSRREVERLVEADFGGSWSSSSSARPPGAGPREVIDNLIDLGIFRARSDGYLDVPDVYLEGLRLKRKGGVARG